jgi:hypothetical protein
MQQSTLHSAWHTLMCTVQANRVVIQQLRYYGASRITLRQMAQQNRGAVRLYACIRKLLKQRYGLLTALTTNK